MPVAAIITTIACSGGTPVAPESASSAVAGTVAAGPDGETLKASKPTPVSPINNVELSTLRPSMQIGAASGKYANQDFNYEFELQTSGGSTVHKQTVSGTSSTPGDDLQSQSTYRWRARAVLGSSFGPWSDFATFRRYLGPGLHQWPAPQSRGVFLLHHQAPARSVGERLDIRDEQQRHSPGTAARRGPWAGVLRPDSADGRFRTSLTGSSSRPPIVTHSDTASPPTTISPTDPAAWSGPSGTRRRSLRTARLPLVRPRRRPLSSLCLSVVAQRTVALRDPRFL